MAPHEDELESKQRAVDNLLDAAREREGRQPTRRRPGAGAVCPARRPARGIEPAKGIYAGDPAASTRPGIVDAAIWIGYAWADEPREPCGRDGHRRRRPAVTATAESWPPASGRRARGSSSSRPTPTLEDMPRRALKSDKHPFMSATWATTRRPAARGRHLDADAHPQAPGVPAERRPRLIYASVSRPGRSSRGVEGRASAAVDGHRRRGGRPRMPRPGRLRAPCAHPARRRDPGRARWSRSAASSVIVTERAKAVPLRSRLHAARARPTEGDDRRGEDRLPGARALRHARRLDADARPPAAWTRT